MFRWNPFARRSGIFSVIHAHCKRNRVVSKHGKLNTYRKPEESEEQHRYSLSKLTSTKVQRLQLRSSHVLPKLSHVFDCHAMTGDIYNCAISILSVYNQIQDLEIIFLSILHCSCKMSSISEIKG